MATPLTEPRFGGLGRDWVFNATAFGQLFGDTIDGVGVSTTGATDSDIFWFWPGTFIMDAQPNDYLKIFDIPLLGGSNSFGGVYAGDGSMAIDWFLPFMFYAHTKKNQLIVFNALFHAMDIGPDWAPASGLPLKGGANIQGFSSY